MKRLLPFIFPCLGILLIAFSIGFYFYTAQPQRTDAASLPQRLAGMPLQQSVTGEEAVKQIGQMHGENFKLDSGAIGMYGSQAQATVWVANAGNAQSAGELETLMEKRIAQAPDVFQPVGQRQVNGRQIYELNGMGQKHFYFQSDRLVIWLAVEPQLAEQALSETLKYYEVGRK